ncbi:hypothetical protein FRB90_005838 [Tulasnella sp. 427]|nr:hypothetical protein FRB90_005838 [Tulasnella sp. 427]
MRGDKALMLAWVDSYLDLMMSTVHWIVAVSGTLILRMAILNTVQRRPQNRLPTIAIGYGVTVVVDKFILTPSVRSIRKSEARGRADVLYSAVEAGGYHGGESVDLSQLGHLAYGQHFKPDHPGSGIAGTHAQGSMGSFDSVYTTDGGEEKVHPGRQYYPPYTRWFEEMDI